MLIGAILLVGFGAYQVGGLGEVWSIARQHGRINFFRYSNSLDFRQSFCGSISITAQCFETQLMPNESSGNNLQIISGHFYIRSLLHSVICITKCQRPSNCFSYSSFFLLATFGQIVCKFSRETVIKISMKLHMHAHR